MNDKDALALVVAPEAVYEVVTMKRRVRSTDVPKADALSMTPKTDRLGMPHYVRVQVPLTSREGLKESAKALAELASAIRELGGRSMSNERTLLFDAWAAVRRANARMSLTSGENRFSSDTD